MNLRNLYATHYFEGEYPISTLISNPEFWPTVKIDQGTLETVVEILDNWRPEATDHLFAELNTKYGLKIGYDEPLSRNYPATVISIQYDEDKVSQAQVAIFAHELELRALELMDESSGDDDFYDYTPGAVRCLQQIIEALGYDEVAKSLGTELLDRGHFD